MDEKILGVMYHKLTVPHGGYIPLLSDYNISPGFAVHLRLCSDLTAVKRRPINWPRIRNRSYRVWNGEKKVALGCLLHVPAELAFIRFFFCVRKLATLIGVSPVPSIAISKIGNLLSFQHVSQYCIEFLSVMGIVCNNGIRVIITNLPVNNL